MKKLKEIAGTQFVSLITYEEDKQILLVVKEASTQLLEKIGKTKYNPLVLREREIKESIDVFPIDLLHIKADYTLIEGKDVIDKLKIPSRELREHLEHEIKRKLIALRTTLATGSRKNKNLTENAVEALKPIMQALFALENGTENIPSMLPELLKQTKKDYPFDLKVLENIYNNKNQPNKDTVTQLNELLTQMSDHVDKLIT